MTSPRETVLCQYHYDPLDRLISHALANIPERQRFYCKSRLATEIQGAMRYSIVQHGDQLLAQKRSEGNAPDTTLLATDQQRSVLQTLQADHPQHPIVYSPYGYHLAANGLLSLLGFNGERPDPITGCYLLGNGYRAFNPTLMRFNSPDSLSPFGKGGLNSYVYCLGDPMNRSDSNGRSSELVSRIFSRWLNKTRVRLHLKNSATANPLKLNQINPAEFTNKKLTATSLLKDRAYNATNTLLGKVPGKDIQLTDTANNLQKSGLKLWEDETGFNNLNIHMENKTRNTFDFHVIGAGIEGKLNGVTSKVANNLSQQIASGETPKNIFIRDAFPTKLHINIHQQREIYRQSGLALPHYFRPDIEADFIRK
ncbi:RHS repeat-associated protein [Pseudomonas lini]|uniref:RHS repeat-associated core domain-containing protein n=1 Tax=Pseudomonas lini TaxID=163011 RepID=UPI0027846117|nr:RHS repeat-associated core domain-containing protein [Pseudomonas lini]MDQ0121364.1 RHS repeat-associated protein [Pseudomonas lini]